MSAFTWIRVRVFIDRYSENQTMVLIVIKMLIVYLVLPVANEASASRTRLPTHIPSISLSYSKDVSQ